MKHSIRFFTAAVFTVALLISVHAAYANHNSAIYTGARCDSSSHRLTVFARNTSEFPSGFLAYISVNGGPAFLSPIIFDDDPAAIAGNSSGSYSFTDPLFTFNAVVSITNQATLPPGGGESIVATCGHDVTFFNPQDGRCDPRPGDRIAVYGNLTAKPPTVGILLIDANSRGYLRVTFNFVDLVKAGHSGLSRNLGSNGIVSVSVDDKDNFWVAWNGGPFGADGQPNTGFAKGCKITFNQ